MKSRWIDDEGWFRVRQNTMNLKPTSGRVIET